MGKESGNAPSQNHQTFKPSLQDRVLNVVGSIDFGKTSAGKKFEKLIAWDRAKHIIDASNIADNLKQGETYLDLGSGPGHISQLLRRKGFNIVSCDPFIKPFSSIRTEQQEHELSVLAAAQHLPFPTDYFDGVMTNFVLHHASPQDWPIIFEEIERVINPGGTLILIEDVPLVAGDHSTVGWDSWTNGKIGEFIKDLVSQGEEKQNPKSTLTLAQIALGDIVDLHLTDKQWSQIFKERNWELIQQRAFVTHDPISGKDIRHKKYVLKMSNIK